MQAGLNEHFAGTSAQYRITNVEIKNKKMNKEILAGTNADNSTKDDGLHVSPACIKPNVIGSGLYVGMKFISKWFPGITEVLSINEDENTLDVEIHRASGHNHTEEWNLEHTKYGFERGDYIKLKI